MSLRLSLVAATVLLGVFAQPAFAMQTVHVPDSSTPDNGAAPDGLFDKSVPDTWQKKSDVTGGQSSQSSGSGFHFSFTSSGGSTTQAAPTYGNANVPGSEFRQPLQGTAPYYPQ